MAMLQATDIIRRSASKVTTTPQQLPEVAKLIDVSKCIGCKACQAACLEWNDRREEVGVNSGSYQNPDDLYAHALHRVGQSGRQS
jgi:formate dehydrogenase iron-sulfur subunit